MIKQEFLILHTYFFCNLNLYHINQKEVLYVPQNILPKGDCNIMKENSILITSFKLLLKAEISLPAQQHYLLLF